MEAFGLAAGVLQVAGFGAEVGSTLWRCAKKLHNASKELESIAGQVETTALSLRRVDELLKDPATKALHTPKLYEDTNTVSQGCHEVFRELDKSVKVYEAKSTSGTMRLLSRTKWLFDSGRLEELGQVLRRYNDVLHLMVSVMTIVEGRRAATKDELQALEANLRVLALSNKDLSDSNKILTDTIAAISRAPTSPFFSPGSPATPSAQSLGAPMMQPGIMFNTLASVPLDSMSVQTAPPPDPTSDHLQRCMDSVQELAKTIACAIDKWHGSGLLDGFDIHGTYAKVSAHLEQLPADVECMRCTRRTYKSALHNPPSRVSSLSSACTCDANSEPAKRRRTSGAPHELAVTDQTKPLTAEHNHAPLIPHPGPIAAASGERNSAVISSSAAQGTSQRRGGRERNSHLSADAKNRSAKMRKLAAPEPARKRVGRVEQQQQQQQPADISPPQTQAGASGADIGLDLEMPILKVSRPVAACPRCRTAKTKCDGKLPACTSCEETGQAEGCAIANEQLLPLPAVEAPHEPLKSDEVSAELEKKQKELKDDMIKAPVKFEDVLGRNFTCPWHLCKTWKGMESLIKQAFAHVDVVGAHVQEGHYDLMSPAGEIVLPQVWDMMVEPGWEVSMHMWPVPETPKKKKKEKDKKAENPNDEWMETYMAIQMSQTPINTLEEYEHWMATGERVVDAMPAFNTREEWERWFVTEERTMRDGQQREKRDGAVDALMARQFAQMGAGQVVAAEPLKKAKKDKDRKKAKRISVPPPPALVAGPSTALAPLPEMPLFNTREEYEHWVTTGEPPATFVDPAVVVADVPKPKKKMKKISAIAAWMGGAPATKPKKKRDGEIEQLQQPVNITRPQAQGSGGLQTVQQPQPRQHDPSASRSQPTSWAQPRCLMAEMDKTRDGGYDDDDCGLPAQYRCQQQSAPQQPQQEHDDDTECQLALPNLAARRSRVDHSGSMVNPDNDKRSMHGGSMIEHGGDGDNTDEDMQSDSDDEQRFRARSLRRSHTSGLGLDFDVDPGASSPSSEAVDAADEHTTEFGGHKGVSSDCGPPPSRPPTNISGGYNIDFDPPGPTASGNEDMLDPPPPVRTGSLPRLDIPSPPIQDQGSRLRLRAKSDHQPPTSEPRGYNVQPGDSRPLTSATYLPDIPPLSDHNLDLQPGRSAVLAMLREGKIPCLEGFPSTDIESSAHVSTMYEWLCDEEYGSSSNSLAENQRRSPSPPPTGRENRAVLAPKTTTSDVGSDDDVSEDVSAVQALLNRWLDSSASALLLKDDAPVT